QRGGRRAGGPRHRPRHRLSPDGALGALGRDSDLAFLRRRRHARAAATLGGSDRTDAQDLAADRAQFRGSRPDARPMMWVFILKFVHVIGASVLLGTGAGIAFFMLLAHLKGDVKVVAGVARIVVIADFLFTATAVVLQPITGVLLAHAYGYNLGEGWIVLSI